jgi:geranyl-CoA carboxylase alpha subunit
MNTCREMGIATVAVYSEADREAVHVLKAGQSVFLGDSEPAQSYLNIAQYEFAIYFEAKNCLCIF